MAVILVVDDDHSVLKVISRLLEDRGHRVLRAGSARRAIQLGRRLEPQDVILDRRLPDGDGLGVYLALRTTLPNLAAFMLTGYGSPDHALECGRAGLDEYHMKPYPPNEIASTIERLIAARAARDTPGAGVPQAAQVSSHPNAQRVARMVVAVARHNCDIRTTRACCEVVFLSEGAIRGWCAAAHVLPAAMIRLGRAVRLVLLAE